MSDIILRKARSTDAGATGAILSAFIDDTPWMPRIHTRAEDLSFAGDLIARGWVTVAEQKGHVSGFIARDEETIHALYIASEARRTGIGSNLLDQMMRETDHLSLWTFQANTDAQAFYRYHGFSEVERTDGSGNDEKMPDIRYAWQRGAA